MQTAFVTPISRKAQQRFVNMMQSNEECIIQQHKGNKLFLTSSNGKNKFWVNLDKDPDWMVDF
jgi:predicted nucleic acid-binding Zn finger protein